MTQRNAHKWPYSRIRCTGHRWRLDQLTWVHAALIVAGVVLQLPAGVSDCHGPACFVSSSRAVPRKHSSACTPSFCSHPCTKSLGFGSAPKAISRCRRGFVASRMQAAGGGAPRKRQAEPGEGVQPTVGTFRRNEVKFHGRPLFQEPLVYPSRFALYPV